MALAPFSAQSQTLPTREEVEQPKPDDARPKPTVRVDTEGAVEARNCPLDGSDLEVQIGAIEFSGPGGAELPAEIRRILAGGADTPPAGKQKVAIVCDLRDRATSALRQAGYVASVQVPPQRLEGGALRLEVVTAHIVEVRVRGNPGAYRKTLESRIRQLRELDPFNERDAERILLLADDIPGLDIHLALRPAGKGPGEVIGELTVRTTRARALFNAQNYGSRQLGRETIYGRAEVFGLTGAADLTYIGAQSTIDFKEQFVVQAGHLFDVNNRGTTVSIAGTHAWSRPDLGALDLRARSWIANLEVSTPLVRSVRQTVRANAGIDISEQTTHVYGSGSKTPLNRDRLRTLYLGISGSTRRLRADLNEAYSFGGDLEVRKGLSILDATLPQSFVGGFTPSRFEGDSRAWVVRGNARGLVAFGPVSVLGEAHVQWADRPLLNFDEFSIGNLTVGRGYDPGANSGDSAIGLHGEARVNLYTGQTGAAPVFDLFAFKDQVWLWNKDTGSAENGRSLGSFGAGVRVLIPRLAAFEATYARPEDPALLLPGARRAPDRFLLSLTIQFAPRAR